MTEKHPITAYRETHDLTQEALAKELGVETPTVSRWEQRKRTPRGDDLRRICAFTGISAAEILGVPETAP